MHRKEAPYFYWLQRVSKNPRVFEKALQFLGILNYFSKMLTIAFFMLKESIHIIGEKKLICTESLK